MTGRRTIALLPVALLLLLASCGGDDSPQADKAASASGATGTTGPQGSNGPDGARETDTGGAAPGEAPAAGEEKKKRKKKTPKRDDALPTHDPTIEGLQKRADKLNEALEKDKKGGNTNAGPAPPAPKPSAGPQVVLYRKAKRVCKSMGLDALASRYGVAADPEAVATAYAKSYPETFRNSVHDGCKSALAR